ncbi:MAG: DNA-processing protein DprA [Oscillospiraceae bacterium]|nr:DNA-processing protein DprA [Oscillospiraceae bacterium]
MLIHWLWLATRPDLSDRVKVNLLRHFRDAEDIYYADGTAFSTEEELCKDSLDALLDKDLTQAKKILDECDRKHIHILTYRDAAYPNRLRNIVDPPVVLYYKGRLPEFDALPIIGVVGTRKATPYGLTIAKRMGYQIAACGGIVVSGMAYGIDGMAMQGALTAGSPVVGVLGNGVDVVYPQSNRSLFADVERAGCLLSEFAPGTEPFKWNFPKRNRIISGLSCGVLVIEAPEKSGALITARQASDQGRDVFAVPGNIDMPSCAGSNELLRDGAMMASSGWDVMREYQAQFPDKIQNRCKPGLQMAYPDEVARAAQEAEMPELKVAQKPGIFGRKKSNRQKKIDNDQSSKYIGAEEKRPSLMEQEQAVFALVQEGKSLVDDIIAQTQLPAGVVLAALTMLEVKGLIVRLPGKRVKLK